ncbi:MAG: hypothetical protein IKQ87_04230, partial [Clostridia bacterium]|nr:hypothetical protein [Clostridia bacterium]
GRSTLYAVYAYFEKAAGCRYFWDGDIVPRRGSLPLDGFDLVESPRFEYRGLRYFAHRSLTRFQAEHWNLGDWKREIDWMLKKRLNMFMLRIGMDDVFQKAFPDIVDYPSNSERLPEAGPGYDDRTTFWSLQDRGQLRHDLLAYAFARDLMHPEDCGTMTHWYSRTPLQFLEKVRPTLLAQVTGGYNQQTGLVWDILDDRNLANYFKLTEAHIRNYGRPELFHTIGLAERRYSDDREENKRLKLYVYRRITRYLAENYPNAPLLLASWDLWMYYTPEEVRQLVAELDPEQTILLDYTSDTVRDNNFTNWGVVGKFPWIFGIFGGFEPDSDVRGNYDLTEERLKVAKDDPFCRGLIFWPELSHSDTLMTEYLADNAWSPLRMTMDERLDKYCDDRYQTGAETMKRVWKHFLPLIKLKAWSNRPGMVRQELFFNLLSSFRVPMTDEFRADMEATRAAIPDALALLGDLGTVDAAADDFIRRDVYDIARTTCGRMFNLAALKAMEAVTRWSGGEDVPRREIEDCLNTAAALLDTLGDILAGHEDYSMYETLERLKTFKPVNPLFEATLKNNASCGYCRSYIYENVRFLYQPEFGLIADNIRRHLDEGKREFALRTEVVPLQAEADRRYFETPLADLRPAAVRPLPEAIGRLSALIRTL